MAAWLKVSSPSTQSRQVGAIPYQYYFYIMHTSLDETQIAGYISRFFFLFLFCLSSVSKYLGADESEENLS